MNFEEAAKSFISPSAKVTKMSLRKLMNLFMR